MCLSSATSRLNRSLQPLTEHWNFHAFLFFDLLMATADEQSNSDSEVVESIMMIGGLVRSDLSDSSVGPDASSIQEMTIKVLI